MSRILNGNVKNDSKVESRARKNSDEDMTA